LSKREGGRERERKKKIPRSEEKILRREEKILKRF
jgi:hypothetical protein